MSVEVNNSPGAKSKIGRIVRRCIPLLIVLGAICAVVALAVALPTKSRNVPPTEPPAVNVKVQVIRPVSKLADTFVLHGAVEPNRIVKVAAEVSGQIKALGRRKTAAKWLGRGFPPGSTIAEGEPVTKGDTIVLLDTDLLQAEYDRDKAQADYDRREYARIKGLYEKDVATKTELDQAGTQMEISKAELATSREKLERATITAPIDGILNKLPEEVGQFVQPGTCIAQIVDIRTAKVALDVPEKDVHYLTVGQLAEVLIDSLEDRKTAGGITFISELADEKTRTTLVEVSVDNEQRLLRSGQIVRVRLTRRILSDVIMIPLGAVIPLESGKVVYVAAGQTAQRREVKLGFLKGVSVQVLEGLRAGDKLIVSGHRYVGPGQKVRIISPDGGPEPATRPAQRSKKM